MLKALEVELYEETRIAKRNVVGLLKEVVIIRKDEMFILPVTADSQEFTAKGRLQHACLTLLFK